MKNIKYGENKHNRTRSSLFVRTKTPSVTIQGNITAMRYRNGVIRLVFLLHIHADLGMMLARDYASCHVARSTVTYNACSKQRANGMMLARDYASCHVARSTVTYNACSKQRAKSLKFKCKVRAQPLQLNLRELTRVIHQKCAVIHRHILSMSSWYRAVDATPGGCTKY